MIIVRIYIFGSIELLQVLLGSDTYLFCLSLFPVVFYLSILQGILCCFCTPEILRILRVTSSLLTVPICLEGIHWVLTLFCSFEDCGSSQLNMWEKMKESSTNSSGVWIISISYFPIRTGPISVPLP